MLQLINRIPFTIVRFRYPKVMFIIITVYHERCLNENKFNLRMRNYFRHTCMLYKNYFVVAI